MGKNNMISGILVMVVILSIVVSTYMVVTYASGVLTTAVAFASSDQIAKIQSCGITLPTEFYKLRADIPNMLLPAVYVGWPALMIFLSLLMFIAGYFYGNESEGHSSSETTTKTSHPGKSDGSGGYEQGTRIEETRTQRSSRSERN